MSCLDYCSCPQLSSLQGFLHTEAQEVFTEQNSVTSLKPDSLRRRRPCKRKSLPPSSVYTHCLTYSASHCTPDTPIYSLTELLSVPLICCFGDTSPQGVSDAYNTFPLYCFTLAWLTPVSFFCLTLNVISFKKLSCTLKQFK